MSGDSVSLSSDGNTVAIGATGNDGNGLILVMYVFMRILEALGLK